MSTFKTRVKYNELLVTYECICCWSFDYIKHVILNSLSPAMERWSSIKIKNYTYANISRRQRCWNNNQATTCSPVYESALTLHFINEAGVKESIQYSLELIKSKTNNYIICVCVCVCDEANTPL